MMDIENSNEMLLNETISKYEKEQKNDNGWSNRTLHSLRVSLQSCKKRYFLHSEQAHKCDRMNKFVSIPGFLAGSFASSLALYIVGSPDSLNKPLSISIAILSTFSSIMSAFENNMRYKEQEFEHRKAMDVYAKITRSLEMHILTPDKPVDIVLSEVKKDYDNAITNSPYVLILR